MSAEVVGRSVLKYKLGKGTSKTQAAAKLFINNHNMFL